MSYRSQLNRWLLIATCAFETLFFLFVVSFSYSFERAFHIPHNFQHAVLFVLAGMLSLFSLYMLFRRRMLAMYTCALLFGGTIVWILIDTFSDSLHRWTELIWIAPPLFGLGLLVINWMQAKTQLVERHS